MKKSFKFCIAIWTICFILFNIFTFVPISFIETEKYTPSFWLGYVFIALCFIGQLLCSYFAFKPENLQKLFYNIPIITVSIIGLVVSCIVGIISMLISVHWVGILLCFATLAVTAILIIKAKAVSDLVSDLDKRIVQQTFFIKSMTIDADEVVSLARTDEIKKYAKTVYEEIRYSDPISNISLAAIESQITVKFEEFSGAVRDNDTEKAKKVADELVIIIRSRNQKCKLLK